MPKYKFNCKNKNCDRTIEKEYKLNSDKITGKVFLCKKCKTEMKIISYSDYNLYDEI